MAVYSGPFLVIDPWAELILLYCIVANVLTLIFDLRNFAGNHEARLSSNNTLILRSRAVMPIVSTR